MKSCWVELLYVGAFFGDTSKVEIPADKCEDDKTLAAYLAAKDRDAVAFRRFKDGGWVYFRGVRVAKEEIRRVKETYPDFPLDYTLWQNVKYNNFDIIWFKDYGRVYPFRGDDSFVKIGYWWEEG